MSCRFAEEVDLDAYLVDARDEAFAAFRAHWPACPDCALRLHEAAAVERAMRSLAVEGGVHPEPETLVVWLDAAAQLPPGARDELGRHVAGCVTCADEVRALRRRDAVRSIDPRRAAPPPRRRPLRWVAAAAAVALLVLGVWLARSPRTAAPPPTPVATQVAPPPLAPAPSERAAAIAPEAPSPAPPAVAEAPSAPAPRADVAPAPVAAVEPPPRAPEPARRVAPAPAPAPEPTPARVEEPVVVAMAEPSHALTYVAPAGVRSGTRRTASVVRSSADAPHLVALAPDHVGRTGRAAPTLYFHLDRAADAPIEVALVDPAAVEPLAEFRLAPPLGAGMHAVDLAQHGVSLAPGVAYEWSVALVRDDAHRSADVVAGGAIERVAAPPAASDADALAQAGLFYDALAAVQAEIAAKPSDPGRRERRASLLEQVGLGAVSR